MPPTHCEHRASPYLGIKLAKALTLSAQVEVQLHVHSGASDPADSRDFAGAAFATGSAHKMHSRSAHHLRGRSGISGMAGSMGKIGLATDAFAGRRSAAASTATGRHA